MAVATSDVPRLHQLVSQARKAHASVSKIVHLIEDAMSGTYHVRGYSERDHDMSLLSLRLGGRRLLYAFSWYAGIPSLRTLRRHASFTKLMPSFGFPREDEVIHNIQEIFVPKAKALATPDGPALHCTTGVSVLWDEISQEETACYFPHADTVGALCREHSWRVNLQLLTLENAISIARALWNGKVHFGKEASVVAIASFGTRLRGAFPVLVSPTCKTKESTVLNAWKSVGANLFGPVWSFASDGDAGRRSMVYDMFMKYTVGPMHRLYQYLGGLPGLNLCTGEDDITADFDWKHEIKRIGRVFLTLDGFMIGDTLINFHTLRRYLLKSHTLEKVDRLLNPEDSQDVPRAIELIEAVAGVRDLSDSVDSIQDPSMLKEIAYIGVVGEMFLSFMDAFISVESSLTDQLISLSKFAHACFALFERHGTNFMPNQLYGDMQTTVKNVFFCVAKQLDLDPSQPLYLFNMGGHNPNFTYKQLLDRLAAAVDLDAIFTRNPELHTGFRRLKVNRKEQLDHLNPESWNIRKNLIFPIMPI
ncbi:hypothetical protein K474DRAFT_1686804 [Panus rudis PR-1116 ss-1]|nr:hypothetical protein K474DRAFT_1686804 [Panus rudis PR-1116 ss-1]